MTAIRRRIPVSATVSALFLGGALVAAALGPARIEFATLVPAALGRPSGWYRLLTYSFVHAGLPHLVVVTCATLVSGWLAERWLTPRAMCVIACIAALGGGVLYALLARPLQPAIGGGFVAAGFAGAAVAASTLRRRAISRGTQLVALVLLLVYGLSALRADAQSLATLGVFIAAGGYAAWRLAYSVEASA